MAVLLNETPLLVVPTLALYLGSSDHAIITQQVYWLTEETHRHRLPFLITDGYTWVRLSHGMATTVYFKWIPLSKWKRMTADLMQDEVLFRRNDLSNKGELWYRVDSVLVNSMTEPTERVRKTAKKRSAAGKKKGDQNDPSNKGDHFDHPPVIKMIPAKDQSDPPNGIKVIPPTATPPLIERTVEKRKEKEEEQKPPPRPHPAPYVPPHVGGFNAMWGDGLTLDDRAVQVRLTQLLKVKAHHSWLIECVMDVREVPKEIFDDGGDGESLLNAIRAHASSVKAQTLARDWIECIKLQVTAEEVETYFDCDNPACYWKVHHRNMKPWPSQIASNIENARTWGNKNNVVQAVTHVVDESGGF